MLPGQDAQTRHFEHSLQGRVSGEGGFQGLLHRLVMQDVGEAVFLRWLGAVRESGMHHGAVHDKLLRPFQLCIANTTENGSARIMH